MKEKSFFITSDAGLHARPATELVKAAGRFTAESQLEFKGKKVNMKSIMGVLSLGIPKQSPIKIMVDGIDEADAFTAIETVMLDEHLII